MLDTPLLELAGRAVLAVEEVSGLDDITEPLIGVLLENKEVAAERVSDEVIVMAVVVVPCG